MPRKLLYVANFLCATEELAKVMYTDLSRQYSSQLAIESGVEGTIVRHGELVEIEVFQRQATESDKFKKWLSA